MRRLGFPPREPGADASVCHGRAGEAEFLIHAATAWGNAGFLDAARAIGARMVERAALSDRHPRQPSLLLGWAGAGLVLLRLEDPALAPMALLPPLVHASRPAEIA